MKFNRSFPIFPRFILVLPSDSGGNTCKPFSFPNHPQLSDGPNPYHQANTSGDTPGTSKDELKRLLVELVDSCEKSVKEKCSLQFLQQLGENRRFNIFLCEGDIVDKPSMLTISVLFQLTKKIQAILGS